MKYRHAFGVRASLPEVARFHQKMESFKALNPPPIVVRLHQAADNPQDGDQMKFTLWLGPIPVRWVAQFSQVSPQGFTDTQIKGPFQKWIHQHRFHELNSQLTEVEDIVEVEIGINPLTPIAIAMWLGLPLLFGYRAWQTRKILEASSEANENAGVGL